MLAKSGNQEKFGSLNSTFSSVPSVVTQTPQTIRFWLFPNFCINIFGIFRFSLGVYLGGDDLYRNFVFLLGVLSFLRLMKLECFAQGF